MEDLIGILVAVGIIIFRIWTGIKGESEETTPTTTTHTDWEEEDKPFDPEEVEWMDETVAPASPAPVQEKPQKAQSLGELLAVLKQAPRTEEAKHAAHKPVEAPRPVAPQPVVNKRPSHSIGQRLQSPQEARRAFIYSEIFKKKYE